MDFLTFETAEHTLSNARLFVRTGGSGPPLLLLHGYPQTSFIWHRVAPLLAPHFSLVMPELRGYGRSIGPAPLADGANYSKREMALDMVELMTLLGHDRFCVAGHDRGGRVAYRLALDHPQRVHRLAVLDIVPTIEMWDKMGHTGTLRSYHWSFLAQPAPMPERLIGADPEFYLTHLLHRWAGDPARLAPAAVADYLDCFRRAEVIHASCADYRAGAGIDIDHDRADRDSGRQIDSPTLVIWARQYLSGQSPKATWQRWASEVTEAPLDCGHFVAEEQPDACATALRDFMR